MNRQKAQLKQVLQARSPPHYDHQRRPLASSTTMASMQTMNSVSKQNIKAVDRNDDHPADIDDELKQRQNQVFFRNTSGGFLSKSRGGESAGTSTAFHSRLQGGTSFANPSFSSMDQNGIEFIGSLHSPSATKTSAQKKYLNISQQPISSSQSILSPLNSPAKAMHKTSKSSKLNDLLLQVATVPTTNIHSQSTSYIPSPFKAQGGSIASYKWFQDGKQLNQHSNVEHISQMNHANSNHQVIPSRTTTAATSGHHFRRGKTEQLKGFGSLDQNSLQAMNVNNLTHKRVQSQKKLPSSGLLEFPSLINFEEISENFKESMELLDKCEMKKLQLQDFADSSVHNEQQPKSKKPDCLFKPNVATLEQKLVEGRANWVELGMNEFTYFCVRVKGQQSPLRVRINQDKAFTFNILVSREFSMPSQFNCDFKLQGNLFTFDSDSNPESFTTQEFFYFAIFSNQESTIRVHVSFGAYFDAAAHKKVNRTLVLADSNPGDGSLSSAASAGGSIVPAKAKLQLNLRTKVNDLTNNQLRQEVLYIMEKRRQRVGGGGIVPNLIQKNIENLQSQQLEEALRSKYSMKLIKKAKIQQVQEQRDQILESHADSISRKKEDRENKKYEKIMTKMGEIRSFQKKTFDFYWISSIVLAIAIEKLNSKLQKHKERQRIMRDMAFSLLRPFFKYKTRARKIGGVNIHARCLLDSKYVIQDYAKIKKRQVVPQAEMVIASILEQNKDRFLMIEKVLRYINYGKRVVKQLQGFHLKVVNYKKLLFRFWDKYYGEIISQILEVKYDVTSLKDPSLAKRYMQNVLLSFNHLDHKRNAIDAYYKVILSKYVKLLAEAGLYSPDPQTPKSSGMMITAQMHSGLQSPISHDEDIDDSSSEKSLPQKKPKFIYPRLFVLPSQDELKKIILNAAVAVSKNYPELQRKVNFKIHPTP